MMWEKFGQSSQKGTLSWTECWYEAVGRDAPEPMRSRQTDCPPRFLLAQMARRFASWSVPPLARGMMWSTSRRSVLPQSTHRCWSRARIRGTMTVDQFQPRLLPFGRQREQSGAGRGSRTIRAGASARCKASSHRRATLAPPGDGHGGLQPHGASRSRDSGVLGPGWDHVGAWLTVGVSTSHLRKSEEARAFRVHLDWRRLHLLTSLNHGPLVSPRQLFSDRCGQGWAASAWPWPQRGLVRGINLPQCGHAP